MNVDPVPWALHGGEEYELLFTVPPKYQRRLEHTVGQLRIPVTAIGVITPHRSGLRITQQDGTIQKLIPQSYAHFSN
jgi:thiamine-monophosphate kinase